MIMYITADKSDILTVTGAGVITDITITVMAVSIGLVTVAFVGSKKGKKSF
jgi:hypothetical protein